MHAGPHPRAISLAAAALPRFPPADHPNAAAALGTPAGHPNAAAALGTPAPRSGRERDGLKTVPYHRIFAPSCRRRGEMYRVGTPNADEVPSDDPTDSY